MSNLMIGINMGKRKSIFSLNTVLNLLLYQNLLYITSILTSLSRLGFALFSLSFFNLNLIFSFDNAFKDF